MSNGGRRATASLLRFGWFDEPTGPSRPAAVSFIVVDQSGTSVEGVEVERMTRIPPVLTSILMPPSTAANGQTRAELHDGETYTVESVSDPETDESHSISAVRANGGEESGDFTIDGETEVEVVIDEPAASQLSPLYRIPLFIAFFHPVNCGA